MEQRLQFHLEFVRDREIVVWGTGSAAEKVVRTLENQGIEVAFFVSKDFGILDSFCGKPVNCKECLEKSEVYVIEATYSYTEISQELEELGFEVKSDYYNWYAFALPYDCSFDGVQVGKCSYFPNHIANFMGVNARFQLIESIGRFTSINDTAQIHGNHSLESLSTGIFEPIVGTEYSERLQIVTNESRKKLEIGSDVWIGANVFINAAKVKKIGNGAIIGSGAVVLEDVPPFAVVVGVPAKVKKYRFTMEEIKILNEVKWWDWSNSEIKEKLDYIVSPEKFFKKYRKR